MHPALKKVSMYGASLARVDPDLMARALVTFEKVGTITMSILGRGVS